MQPTIVILALVISVSALTCQNWDGDHCVSVGCDLHCQAIGKKTGYCSYRSNRCVCVCKNSFKSSPFDQTKLLQTAAILQNAEKSFDACSLIDDGQWYGKYWFGHKDKTGFECSCDVVLDIFAEPNSPGYFEGTVRTIKCSPGGGNTKLCTGGPHFRKPLKCNRNKIVFWNYDGSIDSVSKTMKLNHIVSNQVGAGQGRFELNRGIRANYVSSATSQLIATNQTEVLVNSESAITSLYGKETSEKVESFLKEDPSIDEPESSSGLLVASIVIMVISFIMVITSVMLFLKSRKNQGEHQQLLQ